MDYYTILGVPRNATPEQIKKAYRQKAKQYHPDRPDGDSEMFKRVSEAYEILSNSDKRSAYDNPQPDFNFRSNNFRSGNPFAGSPFEDMFSHQFGFNRRQPQKNKDIVLSAKINLEEVYSGKSLIMQYRLQSGKVETVDVQIPPGAKNGDQIRFEGLGDDGLVNFRRGDLHVKISINPSDKWLREGNNLITKKSVNVFDLLLGCAIIIKTPDQKSVKLNIPKATKPGTMLSISGYGLPDLSNSRIRGNIIVQINAEIPKINDENILEEISNIRNKIYTKD